MLFLNDLSITIFIPDTTGMPPPEPTPKGKMSKYCNEFVYYVLDIYQSLLQTDIKDIDYICIITAALQRKF